MSIFTFEELPGGKTKFTVRWSAAKRDRRGAEDLRHDHGSMNQGWSGTLEQLEAYLAKVQGGVKPPWFSTGVLFHESRCHHLRRIPAGGRAACSLYAATRPDVFQVRRTATIQAPPEKIFPLINDFKSWTAWSPYEKKDPAMKRTYGAATAGKGATYAWDGDKNVGSGSMEIMDAPAPSRVTIKLDFKRPFEAHNVADFTLCRWRAAPV